MGNGMGTTLTFIVAGILWLVYLVPALRRNREFDATEKNAIRLQQALRTFAQSTETPDEIVTELSNREALIRQRERERIDRQHELALRARVRAESHATNPAVPVRQRSVKLGLSALGLVTLVATGVFGFAGAWVPTLVSLGLFGISAVGLVMLNGASVAARPTVNARRYTGLPDVDDSWTPIRTPKIRRSIPEGAGLIVTPETERKVAEAERVARIREQAARVAAEAEPSIDPRFSEIGLTTEEVPAVDINAALRARRAQ